jgi:hypothetical protein
MAVQNPPVKGGFEPPVMSFSAVVVVIYVYFDCQSMSQVRRPISAPQLRRDRTSGTAASGHRPNAP